MANEKPNPLDSLLEPGFGHEEPVQQARATEVMVKYRSYLDTIAERLIAEETLEKDQFDAIVAEIIPNQKKTEPEFPDAADAAAA